MVRRNDSVGFAAEALSILSEECPEARLPMDVALRGIFQGFRAAYANAVLRLSLRLSEVSPISLEEEDIGEMTPRQLLEALSDIDMSGGGRDGV